DERYLRGRGNRTACSNDLLTRAVGHQIRPAYRRCDALEEFLLCPLLPCLCATDGDRSGANTDFQRLTFFQAKAIHTLLRDAKAQAVPPARYFAELFDGPGHGVSPTKIYLGYTFIGWWSSLIWPDACGLGCSANLWWPRLAATRRARIHDRQRSAARDIRTRSSARRSTAAASRG